MRGINRNIGFVAGAIALLGCGWLLASWLFGPVSKTPKEPLHLEENAPALPEIAEPETNAAPEVPALPQKQQAAPQASSKQGALPPPKNLTSPAAVMQDAAMLLAAAYQPGPDAEKGKIALHLKEVIARYSPPDLPPNMVYAVSPGMLKLGYMLLAKRFMELVQQQAEEQIPEEKQQDFMLAAAEWVATAAQCQVKDGIAAQSNLEGAISQEDCDFALQWMRTHLEPESYPGVQNTAAQLLASLASSLKEKATAATIQGTKTTE